MITKKELLTKMESLLLPCVRESTAKKTLNDMEKEKLPTLKETASIPEETADEIAKIVFTRIAIMKGNTAAEKFLKKFDEWRYNKQ